MTSKFLLWGGALTLSAVAVAGSKSYDITLDTPAKAGNAQLTRGEYKLQVEGSNAVFTGMQSHTAVTVPVKVQNTDTKYSQTAVDTSKQGDAVQIKSIELGGSKTKLEFGQ